MSMSDYEKRALREIHAWKSPEITWLELLPEVVDPMT